MKNSLMSKDELTNYIFNFWEKWGAFIYERRTDEELKSLISDNLSTFNGIERELDFIREEFDSGWSEDSEEYKDLDKLWNYINYYKTNFKEDEEYE
jgi:hypothetical protein